MPDNDDPSVTVCDPTIVGSGSGRENKSDQWDKNLSRCSATQKVGTNDAAGHFFYAATPEQILARFQDIAEELLKERRLEN